ncbi:hypothetical protein HDF11_004516 [Tunturiibacter psychrotolerans]
MPKAMLRPSILIVVDSLSEQFRIAMFVFEEQGIPLGGDCVAVKLPLLSSFRLKIISFDFQN